MALIRILVDGYSLLHQWPELAEGAPRHSEAARDALIELLTQYQDASGTPVTIFFDGRGNRRTKPKNESAGTVEVIFSATGQTADALMEDLDDEFGFYPHCQCEIASFHERGIGWRIGNHGLRKYLAQLAQLLIIQTGADASHIGQ